MKYTDDQIRRALGPHKEQISESEVFKHDDPYTSFRRKIKSIIEICSGKSC